MNTIELKSLQKWEHPSNYFGETYEDYYVVYSQHRDSSVLDRSNFRSIERILGSENVFITRASHWAFGWVETILIHQDKTDTLFKANELMNAYSEYPVIDEQDYSDLECNEVYEIWENYYPSLEDRIQLCNEVGISIFAARNESIPDEIFDYLMDTLH